MKKKLLNLSILSIIIATLAFGGFLVVFFKELPQIQNNLNANQDQASKQLQDLANKQDQQQEAFLDTVTGSNERVAGLLSGLSGQIARGQQNAFNTIADFMKELNESNDTEREANKERIDAIEEELIDSKQIQSILASLEAAFSNNREEASTLAQAILDSGEDSTRLTNSLIKAISDSDKPLDFSGLGDELATALASSSQDIDLSGLIAAIASSTPDLSGIITAIEGIDLNSGTSTDPGTGSTSVNTDCNGTCLIASGFQNIGTQNSVLFDQADSACSANGIATAFIQPQGITDYFDATPAQSTTQYGVYVYKDSGGVHRLLATLVNGVTTSWFSLNSNPTSSLSLRVYQIVTVCN